MAVGILPKRGRAVRDGSATLAAKGLVGHLGLRGERHGPEHVQAPSDELKKSWISLVHFERVFHTSVGSKALSNNSPG